MNCPNCGASVPADSNRCVKCGSSLAQQPQQVVSSMPQVIVNVQGGGAAVGVDQQAQRVSSKSKIAAGLFGIFLGWLGVHRFYLGYSGIGGGILALTIIGALTSWMCIGIPMLIAAEVWGLIEGILILAGVIDKDASGATLQ